MSPKSAKLPHINDPSFVSGGRSAKSYAFETLWRAARPDRQLPESSAFLSTHVSSLISNIMIIERSTRLRGFVRTAGSEILALAGPDIVGCDYIALMPEAFRKEAWWSLGAMVSRPCGLWELMPVHFGPDSASVIEITGLPVIESETGQVLVASYMEQCATTKAMSAQNSLKAETAITYEFIDLGVGIPDL